MRREAGGGEGLENVAGAVYGVRVQGRLPAAFQEYLLPAPAEPAGAAAFLELRHRRVDGLPEVDEIWVSEGGEAGPEELPATRGRFALFRLPQLPPPEGFGLTVSDEGRGLFRCTPEAIEIEWTASGPGDRTGAAHYLFTYALPLWLESRGVPVLHASAVSLDGRAVAFVGRTGMGKSLLSAELLRLGCGFVADDGLALRKEVKAGTGPEREGSRGGAREPDRESAAAWRGYHGPPLLRLWPSGLEGRLGIAARDLPRVHETLDKRRWALTGEGAGEGGESGEGGAGPPLDPEAGLPLAAVYVLRRRLDAEGPVEVSEHAPRDALVRLLQHGVAAAPAAALGLSARRLDLLADLAETVPVRELRFPSGADSAERILEKIRAESGIGT